MSHIGTIARDHAINAEVRKIAYRQTKDGVVISFLLHPNDVPDGLAISDLGARYIMALVQIGDDEQPIQSQTKKTKIEPAADLSARPRKTSPEKRLAQQAGIACADPVFQRFMIEHYPDLVPEMTEANAADAVRNICGVESRAEILPGSDAAFGWDVIWGKFTAWKLAV